MVQLLSRGCGGDERYSRNGTMTQGNRLRVYAIYRHVFYGNMQFHLRCNFTGEGESLITGSIGIQYYVP
jgi:hypothetical protein